MALLFDFTIVEHLQRAEGLAKLAGLENVLGIQGSAPRHPVGYERLEEE